MPRSHPANEAFTSAELVARAIENHASFKAAVAELDRREPSEEAARVLIDAYAGNRAPSWLIACLLGHNRHPLGYETLLEIMKRVDSASDCYAPYLLPKVDRDRAERDLTTLLDHSDDSGVRKNAAVGLCVLATPEAIACLRSAIRSGRIPPLYVARQLRERALEPEVIAGALGAESEPERRFALAWVAHFVEPQSPASEDAIARAPRDLAALDPLRGPVARALSSAELGFLPRVLREHLDRWLAR